MKNFNKTILILSTLGIILISSCANRPYFVIENNTKDTIRLEFIYDSLDIYSIASRDKIDKLNKYRFYNTDFDSLYNYFKNSDDTTFGNYIYDSLSLLSLSNMDQFLIGNLEEDNYLTSVKQISYINHDFSLLEYYNNDSALIQKLIDKSIVTYFVPPKNGFYTMCYACGDCSCYAEFPDNCKIRVVFDKEGKDYIELTDWNFHRLMNKKKFKNQKDSYVLKFE